MTPPAVLDVIDLRAGYGGLEVLAGVSLRVGRGQFVSVIGPNGAGKSTCLRAIFGLVPARGRVVLDGEDVQSRACGPPPAGGGVRPAGEKRLPRHDREGEPPPGIPRPGPPAAGPGPGRLGV